MGSKLEKIVLCRSVVLLGVFGVSYYNQSEQEKETERSLRYLTASTETEGAEERFLSFSEDYNDKLGGVAQYQAAVIQYRDQRYDEAAKNFEEAAKKLTGHPLQGRVLLGQAVSLIKSGDGLGSRKRHWKIWPIIPGYFPRTVRKRAFYLPYRQLERMTRTATRSIMTFWHPMRMRVISPPDWKN